jgi:hypothetical protein
MALFGRKPAGEAGSADEQAIERYRYLLRTAPPETIEQAHAEAFAQLTPEQRRLVLQKLGEGVPASERAVAEPNATPQALARVATRAEVRQPGTLERAFGQAGGMSMGGLVAGTLLSSIAGTVLGSMIAREFFAGEGERAAGLDNATEQGEQDPLADADQSTDDGGGVDMGGFEDV